MLDQNFSASNFLKLTTKADPRKHNLGRRKSDYKKVLEQISNEIHHTGFAFKDQCKIASHGELIYKTTNRTDTYALRKLSDNLSRLHDAKQASRSQIIDQVVSLLNETVPYFVIKLDIKKFYDNIDCKNLINVIKVDPRPSYHTKRVLDLLTRTPAFTEAGGLPRGLGVSATLSEIALKNFDKLVTRIPGVYYYARYVDDMIVFTYENPERVIKEVKELLPKPLILNFEKEKIIYHDGKIFSCGGGVSEFDYLGYTFAGRAAEKIGNDIQPRLTIKIAEKKIKKMKTKIMRCLHDLAKSRDIALCSLRLKFLTANVAMKSSAKHGQLYSGIFFNYPKADINIVKIQLSELDRFTRSAIFAKSGALGKALTLAMTQADRAKLARYSFLTGYERKLKYDFGRETLIKIARCWK
ncbi:antiviral reverse transcriptase Drt3a [Janthinobacterium sp. SUN098]|uniref:antiviral reverse transcriptase Drt3a n=1 Tax=Janthinobacterium sp. SUN098 TaxID=3002437 RepID=UPI0038D4EEBB